MSVADSAFQRDVQSVPTGPGPVPARRDPQPGREADRDRLAAGADPGGPDVQALVERHRSQIDRWFYPCSVEMQVNLGDMYVADPRFSASYDRYQPGLARFLCDAIRIRAGLPPATD